MAQPNSCVNSSHSVRNASKSHLYCYDFLLPNFSPPPLFPTFPWHASPYSPSTCPPKIANSPSCTPLPWEKFPGAAKQEDDSQPPQIPQSKGIKKLSIDGVPEQSPGFHLQPCIKPDLPGIPALGWWGQENQKSYASP